MSESTTNYTTKITIFQTVNYANKNINTIETRTDYKIIMYRTSFVNEITIN